MKWPEDARFTSDIRSKLDARLAKFLTDDPGLDGAADGEAIQDLILDLYAIYTTDAGSNAVELRQFMLILGGINGTPMNRSMFIHRSTSIGCFQTVQMRHIPTSTRQSMTERPKTRGSRRMLLCR